MKKIRNLLIIAIILIIIILIVININNTNNQKQNERYIDDENDGIGLSVDYMDYTTMYPVINKNVFATVENCLQAYVNCLSNRKNYNAVLNLLSSKYIENNNINLDNINSSIPLLDEKLSFKAIEMNNIEFKTIRAYSVHGNLVKEETGEVVEEVYYKVFLDIDTMSFSVEPIYNCSDINNIKLKQEMDVIERNYDNEYYYIKVTK